MNTCYMCDKPATSNEHIPPKCFFPKMKDVPNDVNLRQNLITVPSCDEHNTQKSMDDEYMLLILISHFENNMAAQSHFSKQIIRALKRNPKLLHLYKNIRPLMDSRGDIAGATFTIDYERFINAIKQMIRALHFHIYKTKWLGDIKLINNGLMMQSFENFLGAAQYNVALKDAFKEIRELLSNVKKFGANPSVFYYQYFEDNESNKRKAVALRLVFYEGLEFIAILGN